MDVRLHSLQRRSTLNKDCSNSGHWLTDRADDLKKGQISAGYARATIMGAHKKGVKSHQYKVGHQAKVTTEHSDMRATSTQAAKLMPR
jgi:hypothetical protein